MLRTGVNQGQELESVTLDGMFRSGSQMCCEWRRGEGDMWISGECLTDGGICKYKNPGAGLCVAQLGEGTVPGAS